MPRIEFDSFTLVALPGWEDITDTLAPEEPAYTLARGDGVGALQLSVALYTSGPVPDASADDLSEMVASFAEARGLGAMREAAAESGMLRLAAGSFTSSEDFLRVWQVSDGRNFALVTYTCEFGKEGRELSQCEQIVRSIRFREDRGSS